MTAKEQLLRLLRLQELALATRASREVVESAPGRLEEIEARFRERNAEYVAVKDRYDALDEDQRTRNPELVVLEESRKKYMADLMQVQNQREYAAMLKEIDTVKSQINAHEEAILKDMEEQETLKSEIDSRSVHIEEERQTVEKERAEVEASVEEARRQIASCEEERAGIESELPAALVDTVRRMERSRQGLFLVRADDGTCQACYVRVRPQAHQEIKLASRIHYCSNCKRFLYHERTLKPAPDASGVGAVNGETV